MMHEENKEEFQPGQGTSEESSAGDPAQSSAGNGPRGPYNYGVPPYPPQMTPPQPEKTRRIGTVTMGLALIAAGVCALLGLFMPQFDILLALRLSPLILVVLGLEIILNFVIFKGQKLKYDLLSGFVCLMLIMGSLFAAAVPALHINWGPHRSEMENSIRQSVDTLLAERLHDVSVIQSLNSDVYLQRVELEFKAGAAYEDLTPSDHLSLDITLNGEYKDKESFATACRTVLDRLQPLPLEFDNVALRYYDKSADLTSYELTVNNPFAWKQDAKSLAGLVDDSESERQALDEERERMYSDLESEREELNSQMESERSEMNSTMESEREGLSSQMESERAEMNSTMESERSQLAQEREEMARGAA